jgi:hypothetical protein
MDLFGTDLSNGAIGAPAWPEPPAEARAALTNLMTQLIQIQGRRVDIERLRGSRWKFLLSDQKEKKKSQASVRTVKVGCSVKRATNTRFIPDMLAKQLSS